MSNFYSFTGLQKTVEEVFDIDIDPEGGDFEVEQKVYRLETHDIDKVVFKDGHIYYKDGENLHKGFLVLERNYHKGFYDHVIKRESYLPKFHTTRCKTLEKMEAKGQFNGVYTFSDGPLERPDSPEGDNSGEVSDLRICGNCKNDDDRIDGYINTQEFVEQHLKSTNSKRGFKSIELPKQYEKDEWGYVYGWDEISLRYRAKQNFTCEKCGINLSKNKYYLEVHHLNGNKTDNKDSNLQCLCTGCHAHVDRFHRENYYQQTKNKEKLKDFRRLFKDNGSSSKPET